jgi:SH3 domain-containing YSC84-like protein 1
MGRSSHLKERLDSGRTLVELLRSREKSRRMDVTMKLTKRLNIALLFPVIIAAVLVLPRPSESATAMELENRLRDCTSIMREIMTAPDAGIPEDLLSRSSAIIILPSVIKAGLGLGGHYGKGVIMRRNPKTGRWGPPVFLRLIGGSFGWQVGVQSTDMILLVMNEVSLRSFFRDKFTVGVDASVAAGPVGRDASAGTDIALSAGILSYSRAKGIFAGVSVKGSVLEVDWDANESYYGSDISIIDIVFNSRGRLSPAARRLAGMLDRYSSPKRR